MEDLARLEQALHARRVWDAVFVGLTSFIVLTPSLLLSVRSASAQKPASEGDRDEEEILEAVVRDRLRWGKMPPRIGPLLSPEESENLFKPVYAVCLCLPEGKDPSNAFLGRFKPPYAIKKASQCRLGDPMHHPPMLTIGPVRRTDRDSVEVGWDGLGNAGWYRVKREKGGWKALPPVNGFEG